MNHSTYTNEDIKDYCENVIAKVEKMRNEQKKIVQKRKKFFFDDDGEELLEKYEKLFLECCKTLEQLMPQENKK